MPLGPVHHVSLSVTNLERSIAFYRDVLGLRLTLEAAVADEEHEVYLRLAPGTTARVAVLQSGSTTVGEVELIEWDPGPAVLTPPKRPGDPGAFLLAFELTGEELEEVRDRMAAHGIEFWSDITPMHIDNYGAIKAVVCEDPDGLMIELLQLPTREEIKRVRAAYRAAAEDR